jgi:hypothetical protein
MWSPGNPDLSVFTQLGTKLPVQWKAVPDPQGIPLSTRKQFANDVRRSRNCGAIRQHPGRGLRVRDQRAVRPPAAQVTERPPLLP